MFLIVGSSTVCALLTILHEVLVDMGAFSLNCTCWGVESTNAFEESIEELMGHPGGIDCGVEWVS